MDKSMGLLSFSSQEGMNRELEKMFKELGDYMGMNPEPQDIKRICGAVTILPKQDKNQPKAICKSIVKVLYWTEGLNMNGKDRKREVQKEENGESYLRCIIGNTVILRILEDKCGMQSVMSVIANTMEKIGHHIKRENIDSICDWVKVTDIEDGQRLIGSEIQAWLRDAIKKQGGVRGVEQVMAWMKCKPEEKKQEEQEQQGNCPNGRIVDLLKAGRSKELRKLVDTKNKDEEEKTADKETQSKDSNKGEAGNSLESSFDPDSKPELSTEYKPHGTDEPTEDDDTTFAGTPVTSVKVEVTEVSSPTRSDPGPPDTIIADINPGGRNVDHNNVHHSTHKGSGVQDSIQGSGGGRNGSAVGGGGGSGGNQNTGSPRPGSTGTWNPGSSGPGSTATHNTSGHTTGAGGSPPAGQVPGRGPGPGQQPPPPSPPLPSRPAKPSSSPEGAPVTPLPAPSALVNNMDNPFLPYLPLAPVVFGISVMSYLLWKYFVLGKGRKRYKRAHQVRGRPAWEEQPRDHVDDRADGPHEYTLVKKRRQPRSAPMGRTKRPKKQGVGRHRADRPVGRCGVRRRTIIDIHLEVLDECQKVDLHLTKEDFLKIIVEEFMGPQFIKQQNVPKEQVPSSDSGFREEDFLPKQEVPEEQIPISDCGFRGGRPCSSGRFS